VPLSQRKHRCFSFIQDLLDARSFIKRQISNSAGTITFSYAGKYEIISELAVTISTGANPTVSVWLVQNGSNLANTAQDIQEKMAKRLVHKVTENLDKLVRVEKQKMEDAGV
jgi:hypothetical protein